MKPYWTLHLFGLCLFLPFLLFGQTPTSKRVLSNVADEATSQADLHALIEQYYAAYSKKEIDALMALWSSQSPGLPARRDVVKKFFETNENIKVSNLEIRDVEFENNKARFRVTLEMSATDIQ